MPLFQRGHWLLLAGVRDWVRVWQGKNVLAPSEAWALSYSGFLNDTASDTAPTCGVWPDPSPAAHLTWHPPCSLFRWYKKGPARSEKEAKSWLHHSLLFKTQAYIIKEDQQACELPFKGSFINTKLCCFLAVLAMGKTTCSYGEDELCPWLPVFSHCP